MNKSDFLSDKKLFVFDLDGTVYLGEQVFVGAVSFINGLRSSGRRIVFFTNNASHGHEFYLSRLSRMGFSPRGDEIMTSGDVTSEFLLRRRGGKTVYLLGTDELRSEFKESGITLVPQDCDSADIVVSSFDTTLTYNKLERACTFIRSGAEFISTHPDLNCPTESGPIPDSGAITAFITASTGELPLCLGKPYEPTIDMISEKTGVARSEMCVFGDRLYTDIALGKKFGVTSVLVLSGETTESDVLAAQECDRPDFIFRGLGDVDRIMFTDE